MPSGGLSRWVMFTVTLIMSGSMVHGFYSGLRRPWETPKSFGPTVQRYHQMKNIDFVVFYTDPERSDDTNSDAQTSDMTPRRSADDKRLQDFTSSLRRTVNFSNSTRESQSFPKGAMTSTQVVSAFASTSSEEPHIRDYMNELVVMARPINLPVVVLLHVLGSCLAFRHFESVAGSTAATTSLWQLLASPHMMVTLLALILVSTTSMLVNDYYDFKLGNDANKLGKPLQKVPMEVVKRALSYLYAFSLLCVTMIPGVPGRVAVIGGLILTFIYTKHVKPRTWAKNILCASLIALSPLTSGLVAMSAMTSTTPHLLFEHVNWPLVRLVSLLFVGIMGREIAMDINDCEDDYAHAVQTVPVVYGRTFASYVALVSCLVVAALAVTGPLFGSIDTVVTIRRASLAGAGSLLQMQRYWDVARTEGQDTHAIDVAVDEGLLSIVLILASFV